MQIAITSAMFIIGFVACYYLSFLIRKISIKEMKEERAEYEAEYEKWKGYMEKAQKRAENPNMEPEKFSAWKRIVAFVTRVNLAPTVEELNEYEWDFLKEPVKEPEYSTIKRCFIGLIGAICFGVAGYGYGLSLQMILVVCAYLLLILITFVDVDAQIIPPIFNIAIFVLGVLALWAFPEISLYERAIGIVCISVPMLVIIMFVPGGFGGGDIKLMAAAGFLLGWKGCVAAFAIGLVLGGAYGIFVLVTKRRGRKEHFAFGPCLSIGIAVALYGNLGTTLIDLYLSNFIH